MSEFAFEPDTAALHFHKTLGDVQPQPRARGFARFRIIRTEELLEYLRLAFILIPIPLSLTNKGPTGLRLPGPLIFGWFGAKQNLAPLRKLFMKLAHRLAQP